MGANISDFGPWIICHGQGLLQRRHCMNGSQISSGNPRKKKRCHLDHQVAWAVVHNVHQQDES